MDVVTLGFFVEACKEDTPDGDEIKDDLELSDSEEENDNETSNKKVGFNHGF